VGVGQRKKDRKLTLFSLFRGGGAMEKRPKNRFENPGGGQAPLPPAADAHVNAKK